MSISRRKVLEAGAATVIYPAASLILPSPAIIRPSQAQAVQDLVPTLPSLLDGSANAPAGSPQRPNLLDTYHPAGQLDGRNKNNGRQPPWNVAGVDYRVGINAGVALKDPARDTLPPNCTRDVRRKQFHINGNTIVDGWAFTDWHVLVYGGKDVTITNNDFKRGRLFWRADGNAVGGIIRYNSFQAENANTDGCQFIIFKSGTFIVEYNVFDNSFHMLFQITNGQPGQSLFFRYNFLANAGGGAARGAHGDWIQMFGGYTVDDVVIEYNTTVQDIAGYATQGYSLNALTPTIRQGRINNNTAVVKSNTNCFVYLVPKWHQDTFLIQENYVDPSDSSFRFSLLDYHWPGPYSGKAVVKSGNINMLTGRLIA